MENLKNNYMDISELLLVFLLKTMLLVVLIFSIIFMAPFVLLELTIKTINKILK